MTGPLLLLSCQVAAVAVAVAAAPVAAMTGPLLLLLLSLLPLLLLLSLSLLLLLFVDFCCEVSDKTNVHPLQHQPTPNELRSLSCFEACFGGSRWDREHVATVATLTTAAATVASVATVGIEERQLCCGGDGSVDGGQHCTRRRTLSTDVQHCRVDGYRNLQHTGTNCREVC